MNIQEAFRNKKVLVVGDMMLDSYYFGNVDRISPEAPVPVVAVRNKEYRLGGAANVAMNLVALGAKPVVCSVIGNEQEGSDLIRLFQQNGVATDGIIQSDKRVTTVKTRVIAQQTQMLRIDHEITSPVTDEESKQMVEKIRQLISDADVLIFEDYDKGVLTASTIRDITALAGTHNVPVVVDPKKRNFSYYRDVNLFKPNLKELREGLNKEIDPDQKQHFEEVIAAFMKQQSIRNMMITMSERGVMITDGQLFHYIPAHIRKIADVSGAGDTVISVAALCIANGWDNERVATYANLAGGLVCEEVGVVPIEAAKLEFEINELGLQ